MKAKPVWQHSALLAAILLAVAGYSLIWGCFKPLVFGGVKADFSCFYRAGRMVLAGDGAQVYNLNAERYYDARLNTAFVDAAGHRFSLPFVFAPFVLLLFAPLSRLPYSQAELVWYWFNVALLLALPFVLRRRLSWGTRGLTLALVAPVFFVPVTLALMQGQPALLLLFLVAVGFADLGAGHDGRAGAVLALASFKPQLVLPLLLALLVMRKWKALAGFAATGLTLVGISTALVGWRATLHYPQAVLEFGRLSGSLGGEHPENMPNLRGVLSLLASRLPPAACDRIALAISAALLAAMMFQLRRCRSFTRASYSLLLAVTLLVSYHAYLHDFSLLLLPCFLLADYLAQCRWTMTDAGLAGLLVGFYVIPVAPTSMRTTAAQMFAAVFALAAILWLAKGKRRREIAPEVSSLPETASQLQVG